MPWNPGRYLKLALLLWVAGTFTQAVAQQGSVRSELSATTITRDESVTLTVTAVGIDAELDISSLEKDFDVVGRSSSREVRTVNGPSNRLTTSSIVTWALELLPRDVGVFTVPPVKVGDMESQLLTLTVNDTPTGAKRDIFVEASVDNTRPWVQSQVVLSLRVYQAIDIVDGGLGVPTGENLVVERIGEDTQRREVRDGRQYNVTERRFALFAQKSGSLTIEPVTLNVSVPADTSRVRGFFTATRKLTRRTQPITLEVQARPSGGSAWWLPAADVVLESSWAGDPAEARVDQPLSRTIVLRASGVMDTQLPQIDMPAVDGLSLYADEPERVTGVNERGLVAEQRINWAIIPQRAGNIQLPAITMEWFNTRTGTRQIAEIPSQSINVTTSSATQRLTSNQGAANSGSGDSLTVSAGDDATPAFNAGAATRPESLGASNTTLDGQSSALPGTVAATESIAAMQQSLHWWKTLAISLLAAAIVLVILSVFWWLASRRHIARIAESTRSSLGAVRRTGEATRRRLAPLVDIEAVCQQTDARPISRATLAWAARQWPGNPPATLTSLAQMLPNGRARDLILNLDAALYRSKAPHAVGVNNEQPFADLPAELKTALQQLSGTEHESDRASDGNVANRHYTGLPDL